MQNPNFMFSKKKKTWFAKKFAFKNHFLEMKLKVSFSKYTFGKKHVKEMGNQTDPLSWRISKTFSQVLLSASLPNAIYYTWNHFTLGLLGNTNENNGYNSLKNYILNGEINCSDIQCKEKVWLPIPSIGQRQNYSTMH